MAALGQSGRRGEALQVYAEARRLLAGELGLEPGPRLRELHAAILRGDSIPGPAASRPTAGHLAGPAASRPAAGHLAGPAASPAGARLRTPDASEATSDTRQQVTSAACGHLGRRDDAGVRRGTLGQALAAQEGLAFQGRAAELARVWRLLAAPARLPRIVQIHGPPGIGKTAF